MEKTDNDEAVVKQKCGASERKVVLGEHAANGPDPRRWGRAHNDGGLIQDSSAVCSSLVRTGLLFGSKS
jgi:hypothetical protein